MSLIDGNIWAALEGLEAPADGLLSRYAALDQTERLFCALDQDRRRHFLLPLLPDDGELLDESSRGLRVQTRNMNITGRSSGRFLDIECTDRTGHDAFDFIGSHIAQLLGAGENDVVAVVTRVLARWRRFWGQTQRDLLSREEVLGLFGELYFLLRYLLPQAGANAVTSWRGPFGARHDFERAGSTERPPSAVEVKTTTSTRGHIHLINGIEQLVPPGGGQLRLFSLRVRETATGVHSLPSLIAQCSEALSPSPSSFTVFEAALAEAGYSPLQAPEYEKTHFEVEEEWLFEVHDDFPRLIPAFLTDGVPTGVEKVQYVVNLSAYAHLRVATTPEEANILSL